MQRQVVSPGLVTVILAVLLAGGVWTYLHYRRPASEPAAAPPPPASVEPAPPSPSSPPPPAIELPPLADSDEVVRRLVEALSTNPALSRWLVTDDLVRRFVATVDNVARGENPRSHLAFLEPERGFQVARGGGDLTLDPAGYRRYDTLADVVASVDTAGAVDLYRNLKPLFDQAYRDLGYPRGDFDRPLGQALRRVLAAPVVDTPPALEEGVRSYRYQDAELEGLDPVAKQLLRMGPRNTRRIQAKVREIATALGVAGR